MTTPRYRVVTDPPNSVFPVGSTLYNDGAEISYDGWPRSLQRNNATVGGRLEPINDIARRIATYYAKNAADAFMPKSPYDSKYGGYLLPAHLPGHATRRHPGIPKSEADGMPKYRYRGYGADFGGRFVEHGEEFAFLAWPTPQMDLTPINDAARRVVEFYTDHANSLGLPPAPWNEANNSLLLPDLPDEAKDAAQRTADEVAAEEWRRRNEQFLASKKPPTNTRGTYQPFKQ